MPHQWDIQVNNDAKLLIQTYRQVSNISHTSVGKTIVDHSPVAPVAPTTSSFST